MNISCIKSPKRQEKCLNRITTEDWRRSAFANDIYILVAPRKLILEMPCKCLLSQTSNKSCSLFLHLIDSAGKSADLGFQSRGK